MADKTDFRKGAAEAEGPPGIRVEGKLVRDMTDQELNEAALKFEMNVGATDAEMAQAIGQAQMRWRDFHAVRIVVNHEQLRRRYSLTLASAGDLRPGGTQ